MKKEIIMAAAAAAAGIVYMFSMRKMRKALKKEKASVGTGNHHLTDVFSKSKGFSTL